MWQIASSQSVSELITRTNTDLVQLRGIGLAIATESRDAPIGSTAVRTLRSAIQELSRSSHELQSVLGSDLLGSALGKDITRMAAASASAARSLSAQRPPTGDKVADGILNRFRGLSPMWTDEGRAELVSDLASASNAAAGSRTVREFSALRADRNRQVKAAGAAFESIETAVRALDLTDGALDYKVGGVGDGIPGPFIRLDSGPGASITTAVAQAAKQIGDSGMSHSFEDAASSKAHMAANAVVDVRATVQSGYADAEQLDAQLNQVTRAVNDWLVMSKHIAASMGRVQELVTSH